MALFYGARTVSAPAPNVRVLGLVRQKSGVPNGALIASGGGGGDGSPVLAETQQATTTQPSATASTDTRTNSSPELGATLAAIAIFVAGLAVAVWQFDTAAGPTFTAAEGIGAFALFY